MSKKYPRPMEEEEKNEKLAVEVLAENIKKISTGFQQLNRAGIPRAMIRAWLHQKTKVKVTVIDSILEALEDLQKEMLRPMP